MKMMDDEHGGQLASPVLGSQNLGFFPSNFFTYFSCCLSPFLPSSQPPIPLTNGSMLSLEALGVGLGMYTQDPTS